MLELLLTNLIYICIAMAIFAIFWLSNFSYSLFYNIKLLKEPYDKEKLKDGILKVIVVAIGTALYAIGVTLLIAFLNYINIPIDETYLEFLNVLAIVGIFAKASYGYAKQANETLSGIVDFKKK